MLEEADDGAALAELVIRRCRLAATLERGELARLPASHLGRSWHAIHVSSSAEHDL